MNMEVIAANYQAISSKAKEDLKRIENRGVSKAETLEDLRDTTGKSFRTADLEKLMEKYDPEAYAQYSKFAKSTDGARTQKGLTYLSHWMDKVKKGLKGGTISSDSTNGISETNESKLSSKAQKFLKNLRGKYSDYDFFLGNSTDDLKSLIKSGTKEFSVVFSNAELERMANDEKYAQEKLQAMEKAVQMSKEINQKYGFQSAGKNGASDVGINKIGIIFNEDGSTSFFAELEKSSAKQRERIEKGREEKRTEKKAEEKKANKEIQSYAKNNEDAKYATVHANSMEELLEKISAVDWDSIKAENRAQSGGRFDFSI